MLPYGNSSGVIGNFSSITIEIEENDDPYGLVRFLLNPPIYYISKKISNCCRLEHLRQIMLLLIFPLVYSKPIFPFVIIIKEDRGLINMNFNDMSMLH